jgi:hypothetical protein
LTAGALTGAALVVGYVTLLRIDLSMTPLVLGSAAILGALARGAQRPFPGALPASLIAGILMAGVAWLWFRALRRPLRNA